MSPDTTTDGGGTSGRFATTRWSLILASIEGGTEEKKAREALAQLCRIYWRPIHAFVLRNHFTPEDAQDMTQEFFLMVLKSDLFQRADPERGRLRSLLLKSLQRFLIDHNDRSRALKRGGGVAEVISWDDWMAEAPSQLSIPADVVSSWPAERLFDVRWAATVAERALHRLREECEKRGRRRVFDILSPCLTSERDDVSYERLTRELGLEVAETKGLLHRLRQRYRQLLRAEIAVTVESLAEVEEELRYLVAALSAGGEQGLAGGPTGEQK